MASGVVEEYPSFYNKLVVLEGGNSRTLFRTTGVVSSMNTLTNKSTGTYDELYDVAWLYNSDYKDVLLIGFGPGLTARKLLGKYDINLEIVEVESRMLDIARNNFGWKDDIGNDVSQNFAMWRLRILSSICSKLAVLMFVKSTRRSVIERNMPKAMYISNVVCVYLSFDIKSWTSGIIISSL